MRMVPRFEQKFERKTGVRLNTHLPPMQTAKQAQRRVRGYRGGGFFGAILRVYDRIIEHFEDRKKAKRVQTKAARRVQRFREMTETASNRNPASQIIRQTGGMRRKVI